MSAYYRQFLQAIDEGDYDVSDWEAEFLENLLAQQRPLSDKQVAVVRRMAHKYLGEEVQ